MDDWTDWRDVLNNADIDTARLIVQLQMEDAATLSTNVRSLAVGHDAEMAHRLFEQELRELQGDLPNRELGEELEGQDDDQQEAFEAAAFGWKLKQWESHVEVRGPSPQDSRRCTCCILGHECNANDELLQYVTEPEPPVKLIPCSICVEDVPSTDIVQVPCSHHYCRDCLEELYNECMVCNTGVVYFLAPRIGGHLSIL